MPTASSLRVVGIKATPSGRADMTSRDTSARRGLDAAARTRSAGRVAAPEIVAQNYGPPEIVLGNFRVIAVCKPDLRSDARMIQCLYACMQKDSDRWNKVKKAINGAADEARLFFHVGDIWWVHLGVNVGYEIDGKHRDFSRPVIVLKKYNQYSFLALPLTTNPAPNRWRVPIGLVAGSAAFVVLSQLRNIDSQRLIEKKGHVAPDMLAVLKKEASRMNFG